MSCTTIIGQTVTWSSSISYANKRIQHSSAQDQGHLDLLIFIMNMESTTSLRFCLEPMMAQFIMLHSNTRHNLALKLWKNSPAFSKSQIPKLFSTWRWPVSLLIQLLYSLWLRAACINSLVRTPSDSCFLNTKATLQQSWRINWPWRLQSRMLTNRDRFQSKKMTYMLSNQFHFSSSSIRSKK